MSVSIKIHGGIKKVKDSFVNVDGNKKRVKSIWVNKEGNPIKVFNKNIQKNGIFVAVGNQGMCYYSSDGINWNKGNGISDSHAMESLIYGNKIFLACGSGKLYYSEDGITWKISSLSSVTQIYYVKSKNIFFAIVSVSTNVYNIYYSSDGINFTKGSYSDYAPYPIEGNENYFLMYQNTNNKKFYKSSNGISWSYASATYPSTTSVLTEIIYVPSKNEFYGVGGRSLGFSVNSNTTVSWRVYDNIVSNWAKLKSLIYDDSTDTFFFIDGYRGSDIYSGKATSSTTFSFTKALSYSSGDSKISPKLYNMIKVENKFVVVGDETLYDSNGVKIGTVATIYYSDSGISNLKKVQTLDSEKSFTKVVYGDIN